MNLPIFLVKTHGQTPPPQWSAEIKNLPDLIECMWITKIKKLANFLGGNPWSDPRKDDHFQIQNPLIIIIFTLLI